MLSNKEKSNNNKRISFELYKSNKCHQVKRLGGIEFIIETIEHDDIFKYFKDKWYPEAQYLLAIFLKSLARNIENKTVLLCRRR